MTILNALDPWLDRNSHDNGSNTQPQHQSQMDAELASIVSSLSALSASNNIANANSQAQQIGGFRRSS